MRKNNRNDGPKQSSSNDLIFLSEFPMGLLSDRAPSEIGSAITFKVKDKELTIRAAGELGLPTAGEAKVLLCLLEETIRQGFPKKVVFTQRQLMQRLGWQPNADRYERLELALDRLVGTTYYALNHYPDENGAPCTERIAFHLLETFHLHTSADPSDRQAASWVQLSEPIQALLRTRQLKQFNLDQYLEFKSAITQALYRYLHTRGLDGKPQYAENLETLAFERLGIARSYRSLHDVKRKLDKAHAELLAAGFLTDVSYEPMDEGEKVVYRFAKRTRTPAQALAPPELKAHQRSPSPAQPASPPQPKSVPAENDAFADFDTWWIQQPEQWREERLAEAEARHLAQTPGAETIRLLFSRSPGIRFKILRPLLAQEGTEAKQKA